MLLFTPHHHHHHHTHTTTQSLKAALLDTIAAIATAQPDMAPPLWDRVLAAGLVGGPGSAPGVPVIRYDATYQLNEIQARAEDYGETLALINLLNALWGGAGTPPADGGRPYSHLTRFVRDDVFGTLAQRAFRDPRQRWELATACLQHVLLTIESWAAQGAVAQHGQRPPGLDGLLDMLGESSGPAMRALLWVLGCGAERLALERREGRAGAAHEHAVIAALRLLNVALNHDQQTVQALRRVDVMGM